MRPDKLRILSNSIVKGLRAPSEGLDDPDRIMLHDFVARILSQFTNRDSESDSEFEVGEDGDIVQILRHSDVPPDSSSKTYTAHEIVTALREGFAQLHLEVPAPEIEPWNQDAYEAARTFQSQNNESRRILQAWFIKAIAHLGLWKKLAQCEQPLSSKEHYSEQFAILQTWIRDRADDKSLMNALKEYYDCLSHADPPKKGPHPPRFTIPLEVFARPRVPKVLIQLRSESYGEFLTH